METSVCNPDMSLHLDGTEDGCTPICNGWGLLTHIWCLGKGGPVAWSMIDLTLHRCDIIPMCLTSCIYPDRLRVLLQGPIAQLFVVHSGWWH